MNTLLYIDKPLPEGVLQLLPQGLKEVFSEPLALQGNVVQVEVFWWHYDISIHTPKGRNLSHFDNTVMFEDSNEKFYFKEGVRKLQEHYQWTRGKDMKVEEFLNLCKKDLEV